MASAPAHGLANLVDAAPSLMALAQQAIAPSAQPRLVNVRRPPAVACDDETFGGRGAFFASGPPVYMVVTPSPTATATQKSPMNPVMGTVVDGTAKRMKIQPGEESGDVADRRARHNLVEVRRRRKLASLFEQLSDRLGCGRVDKASILQAALCRLDAPSSPRTPEEGPKVEFGAFFACFPQPVVVLSDQFNLIALNRAFTSEWGFSMDDLKTRDKGFLSLVIDNGKCAELKSLLSSCVNGHIDSFRLSLPITTACQRIRLARVVSSVLLLKNPSYNEEVPNIGENNSACRFITLIVEPLTES